MILSGPSILEPIVLNFRLLPWEYGVRNLFRRPARTGLTLAGLTTVVLLVFVVVAFLRGLETSLAVSGDPRTVLVYSTGAAEDIESSAIPAHLPALLAASVEGIERRYGAGYVSPELYAATHVSVDDGWPRMAIVRGVTSTAPLVRRQVHIIRGDWPREGDVLAGRLADVQQALQRQDLSLAAVGLAAGASAAEIQLFCMERADLGIQAILETEYYGLLQSHYRPVRRLGWVVVGRVAGAGVFAGLNTMYGAVVGRVRELAALPGLPDHLAQPLVLVDRQRQRLLGVDILAGTAGGDVDRRVPMIRSPGQGRSTQSKGWRIGMFRITSNTTGSPSSDFHNSRYSGLSRARPPNNRDA